MRVFEVFLIAFQIFIRCAAVSVDSVTNRFLNIVKPYSEEAEGTRWNRKHLIVYNKKRKIQSFKRICEKNAREEENA